MHRALGVLAKGGNLRLEREEGAGILVQQGEGLMAIQKESARVLVFG